MAQLIYDLVGVRGRELKVYDTKCVITTKKTVGSLLTGNFTDGEKTIFLCDIVGIQFKESDSLIGYLQFETPSMQMNNKSDNMFSENTFTFQNEMNGITNSLMYKVYKYVVDRVEELKYGKAYLASTCDDSEEAKKDPTDDCIAEKHIPSGTYSNGSLEDPLSDCVAEDYIPGRTYSNGDTVVFEGKQYVCIAPSSTVWNPRAFPVHWKDITKG